MNHAFLHTAYAVGRKMKMKTKLILIVPPVTVLLAVCLAPVLSGCSTTRQYPMSFATAESALYETLHLDKNEVLNNTIMACDLSKRRMFSVTPGPSRCLTRNTAKPKIAE